MHGNQYSQTSRPLLLLEAKQRRVSRDETDAFIAAANDLILNATPGPFRNPYTQNTSHRKDANKTKPRTKHTAQLNQRSQEVSTDSKARGRLPTCRSCCPALDPAHTKEGKGLLQFWEGPVLNASVSSAQTPATVAAAAIPAKSVLHVGLRMVKSAPECVAQHWWLVPSEVV